MRLVVRRNFRPRASCSSALARGQTGTRGSDCDVLVVSERFEEMTLSERWWDVYRRWEGPVELSPIAVTPDEFERGKRGSGIVAMALADGVLELLLAVTDAPL